MIGKLFGFTILSASVSIRYENIHIYRKYIYYYANIGQQNYTQLLNARHKSYFKVWVSFSVTYVNGFLCWKADSSVLLCKIRGYCTTNTLSFLSKLIILYKKAIYIYILMVFCIRGLAGTNF